MGWGGGQGGGREVDLEEPFQKSLITFTSEASLFFYLWGFS
jgi:hypothetical protein